jgi:hypothetical protein
LTLPSSGLLSGTPKGAAPYNFIVTATDTVSGCTVDHQYSGAVECVPATFGISPPSTALPGGTVGIFYSQAFSPTGGTPPHTFTIVVPPAEPPGLTLSTSGVLSGFPTTAGHFNFAVAVTDAAGISACPQVYTVDVGPPPLPIPPIPLFSLGALVIVAAFLAITGYIAIRR